MVVIKVEGQVILHSENDDYLLFYKGRTINITECLHNMLMDDIKVTVKDLYNDKILFDSAGELLKQKVSPKYYEFFVGNENLDEVLWNVVDKQTRISFEMQNITEEI